MKITGTTSDRIKDYFKKNLPKGYTLDALRISLIHTQGYSPSIVDKAINEMHYELAREAPILKDTPKISYVVVDDKNEQVEVKKKSFWKNLFKSSKRNI